MKCPLCKYDLLLEKKIFSSEDRDLLPKTRYLQAYVKHLKIVKLAEEYKYELANSGRIRDLTKDCLNDMNMALQLKFGERLKNKSWEPWMNQLAEIRNHASHKGTAFNTISGEGVCYLRAMSPKGKITETDEEALPYLEKTLDKIKEKLGITENIERIR